MNHDIQDNNDRHMGRQLVRALVVQYEKMLTICDPKPLDVKI